MGGFVGVIAAVVGSALLSKGNGDGGRAAEEAAAKQAAEAAIESKAQQDRMDSLEEEVQANSYRARTRRRKKADLNQTTLNKGSKSNLLGGK